MCSSNGLIENINMRECFRLSLQAAVLAELAILAAPLVANWTQRVSLQR
jgi:hypothetical protein